MSHDVPKDAYLDLPESARTIHIKFDGPSHKEGGSWLLKLALVRL